MLATRWVAPGKGEPAGYLYDRAVRSRATREVVRLLEQPAMTEEMRRRRTRLALVDARLELEPYDVERIAAAIWERD